MAFHVLQFILFLGRYFAAVTNFAGHFVCWLGGPRSIRVDDSYRIFNLDCLVSTLCYSLIMSLKGNHTVSSIHYRVGCALYKCPSMPS